MMMNRVFNLVKAFGHAIDGWGYSLKERNIKIHLTAAMGIIFAAIICRVSVSEWLMLIFLIGAVISAELFNTAIEEICNIMTAKLKLQYSETTAARDLAAGAVLAVAAAAAIVGLIIFIPRLLTLLA
jgi:diacylglycerol kinase